MGRADADYLIIGAGATGLAFADTLIAETMRTSRWSIATASRADTGTTLLFRHAAPAFVLLRRGVDGAGQRAEGSHRPERGMAELASGPRSAATSIG